MEKRESGLSVPSALAHSALYLLKCQAGPGGSNFTACAHVFLWFCCHAATQKIL